MGNGAESAASHLALELKELAKWGKDDVFGFGQVEFEKYSISQVKYQSPTDK